MQTLLQDLRYSARMLRTKPGFSLVAIITLALGIGANTAIFTVINGVLLRPLPFKESERLMTIWSTDTRRAESKNWTSYLDFVDWRARSQSFERMAVWTEIDHTLTEGEEAHRVRCAWVSADLFPMLGVSPMMGRFFEASEFKTPEPQAVILSHALWRQRFKSTPDLPGKSISINEKSYIVAGVMPESFRFPLQGEPFEVWMPLPDMPVGLQAMRGAQLFEVIGQMRPNIMPEQAQAELDGITAALRSSYPETNKFTGARFLPALEEVAGGFRRPLFVLFGAVGGVLLIACVNVASLLLARGAARQREMAVRSALGAGRFRIVRQLLTESLLLSVLGGGLGILLAAWGVDALLWLKPFDLPRTGEVSLDGRVLGFTLLLSLLTGMIFGLVPAWSASKIDLTTSLKEGAHGTTDSGLRHRLRSALVVAEIALALMLLVGAGLLMKSFWRLRQVDPGFDPNNVLTLRLSLNGFKYQEKEQWADWFGRLQERLQTIPGVRSASVVMPVPLHGLKELDGLAFPFEIAGRPMEKNERPRVGGYGVQPSYFRTLGIRLRAGRDFTARDDSDAPAVVIVNEEFARRYFPNENPLGRRIKIELPMDGKESAWREIVGIAGNVKGSRLDTAIRPEIYTSFAQTPFNEMYVAIKTDVAPHSIVSAVRREVQALDKAQAFYDVRTLDERLEASVAQQRFNMLLLGIFAALALILTAVGLYSVMAYAVTQRTHEIGIRLALGAQPRDVLKLVVGQGMKLTVIGLVIGLAASFALTRVIVSLLFEVSATDSTTFTIITLLLAGVALAACYLPARRATKVDPMVALRYE